MLKIFWRLFKNAAGKWWIWIFPFLFEEVSGKSLDVCQVKIASREKVLGMYCHLSLCSMRPKIPNFSCISATLAGLFHLPIEFLTCIIHTASNSAQNMPKSWNSNSFCYQNLSIGRYDGWIMIMKYFSSHILNMVLSSVKIQNISACNSSSKPIKRQVIQSEIVNREIEEERV